MQKARRHMIYMLRPLVGAWVQDLFHSPFGVLFTVPSRYCPLSVSREYLALPDGPGRFAQDFSCPALLRIPLSYFSLRIRNYHPLWLNFPEHSSHNQYTIAWSYYPGDASLQPRFGLFPVRSPLLGESFIYFLFLEVLRCFSSLGSPP